MRKKKKQFNNIFINNNDQPSYFVVDLKQQIEQKELEKQQKNKFALNQYLEKIVELDIKNSAGKIKNKILSKLRKLILLAGPCRAFLSDIAARLKNRHAGIIKDAKEFSGQAPVLSKFGLDRKYLKYEKKLSQLAFVSLFKLITAISWLIGKFCYRLCYGVGWLAVFLIRFVWFAGMAVIQPIKRIIIELKAKEKFCGLAMAMKHFVVKLFVLISNTTSRIRLRRKIIESSQWVGQKLNVAALFSNIAGRLRRGRNAICSGFNKIEGGAMEPLRPLADLSAAPALRAKGNKKLRPAISFAVILLILILPFKAMTYYKSLDLSGLRGKVLGASEIAINELVKAGESVLELQFSQASQSFSSAGSSFLQAQNELNKINDLLFSLASIAPNQKLKMAADAKNIVTAGQAAAALGNELSLAIDSLFGGNNNLTRILNNFDKHGRQAVIYAENLAKQLAQININSLPAEYQGQFILIQEKSEVLKNGLSEFVDLISKIQIFIGANQDKRYLLVFQNNTELRATGGFIGSYALVDFSNGKIENIEAPGGGSYDTEAGLTARIIAPEPLHLVNPLWHFWDANWWPDWPTSANKLMWFYEKSDGPTVDGVIAFTPTVVEKILSAIGPVDMTDNYGVIIDAENFWLTAQKLSEQKPDKTKEPKKIIGDLMNKIINELPARFNKDTMAALAKAIEENLSQKHILFYFTGEELQNKASDLGWDGRIKQANLDYLMVVNTNIAGGKSDKRIKEVINHTAEISKDGSIINAIEIKRTHTGVKGEPFCGARNVDWMRIYAPLGSELLEARGFNKPNDIYFEDPDDGWQKDKDLFAEEEMAEIHQSSGVKIYQEAGKTVFANWSMVDPGQTITIYLKYRLPFKLQQQDSLKAVPLFAKGGVASKLQNILNPAQKQLFPYALLAQKQSGSMASKIYSTLKLPDDFKIVWRYPEGLPTAASGWRISDDLDVDKYWAVILEKNYELKTKN
ncbi:MAG: DUF4012 domain-containing protein [Patescibacteria group bacterium]|nr:DUF4012 domain-containing protein [Patescibacteria group bacterium]